MSGTHFHLTLPSNASSDIFPDNKTTSYRIKLPQAINLSGEWEVGLYSINYPRTWYTLGNFDTHIYTSDQSGLFSTTIIDYGFYETMPDLVKSVNKNLAKDVSDNIKLTFNVRTEKVTVHLKNKYQLVVTNRMSIVLGFGGKETKIVKTTTSPYAADLHGFMAIYVYCDIVQPQIVGNTSAKLLRSIPVQGKLGDVITKTFTTIQYVPVQTKSFEDVEIVLRNDTGDPVPFERGKVVTTLHFRQRSYFS
ncbi:Hypothetical predicted protein [Paramuricea clavata]|uniref:Uncharacterized protein n=1 Tax=Paramuricea clavata TaxID=317549 RepID=A0A7D9HZ29_PARCT|nr:Hypothetical predicted protein [Paramuricea clavata]